MKKLEFLRREQRLTQTHLAYKAGVSQTLVSLAEAGVATPSEESLEALARALSFSPANRLMLDIRVAEDDAPPEPVTA